MVALVSAVATVAVLSRHSSGLAAGTLSVSTNVDMTPPAPASVVPGSTVSYTVRVQLLAASPVSMTIQLAGGSNLTNRSLVCSSTATPVDTVGSGGAPSCMFRGSVATPVQPGTYTFVFSAIVLGDVPAPVGQIASVVCADRNNTNTCNDEAVIDQTPLEDPDLNTGPLTVGAVDPRPFKLRAVIVAKDGVY
jgi:hypothetical protein